MVFFDSTYKVPIIPVTLFTIWVEFLIATCDLSFNYQIIALSESCFYHIRDLVRICDTFDFTTACTVGTSFVHTKLDYCNSLYSMCVKLIAFNQSNIVSHTLSVKHQNYLMPHLTAVFDSLKCVNVLNIKFSHSHAILQFLAISSTIILACVRSSILVHLSLFL